MIAALALPDTSKPIYRSDIKLMHILSGPKKISIVTVAIGIITPEHLSIYIYFLLCFLSITLCPLLGPDTKANTSQSRPPPRQNNIHPQTTPDASALLTRMSETWFFWTLSLARLLPDPFHVCQTPNLSVCMPEKAPTAARARNH